MFAKHYDNLDSGKRVTVNLFTKHNKQTVCLSFREDGSMHFDCVNLNSSTNWFLEGSGKRVVFYSLPQYMQFVPNEAVIFHSTSVIFSNVFIALANDRTLDLKTFAQLEKDLILISYESKLE